MKILHVIDSGGLYGAEVVLLNLMVAQQALGLKPVLVSIGTTTIKNKPLEMRAVTFGLQVLPVRMKAGPNIAGAYRLFRIAKKEGATLIHSHGYKGNILLGLLPLGWRKYPLITTLHGWTWTGQLSRMMVYEWLDAISLRLIDHVVLVNERMVEYSRLRRLPATRKSVVQNGIAPIRGNDSFGGNIPTEIKAFCCHRFTILGVGRFSPEKNFTSLLRVAAALIRDGFDLQLLLIGEGHERDKLNALAAELGITDKLLMPGFVENVGACLAACQLFAMPSLTEGLPMALLEAMQSGIPIVASRVGGIPTALDEGKCGLLVPVGDNDCLKASIAKIYRHPEAALERAEQACLRVRKHYSSHNMALNYLEVYQQVLGRKSE